MKYVRNEIIVILDDNIWGNNAGHTFNPQNKILFNFNYGDIAGGYCQ